MLFVGSTHTITPKQFVDDLKVLDLSGVGSKAIPNGLREAREGQRTYQEYYDDRYYLQDAPPPQRPSQRHQPSNLTVPKHSSQSKTIQPSPTQSFSSTLSDVSQEKEKKKKKKLFRF